ncbi:MAG: lytic transglycosylase domain-containing protein [Pseudorhodoplanes sp.]|nr:lytic transglycosylase domain-containing protein [Pseudorhodoplanes sp.]
MVGWETPLEVSSSRADITHSVPPETPGATETAKPNEPSPEVPIDLVCDTLADAAAQSELPVAFFARLIWQESGFRQRVVSRAGAQGVAQFMPKTAQYVGLEDPFDPLEALPASARFLQSLHRYFGNLGLAAAAYNAGPRRIQNWLARRAPLPQETRQYVRKITGQEPEKWLEQKPIEIPVHLPKRAPCEGIAGLSRTEEKRTVPAFLTAPVTRLIEEARLAAERARQVKERLVAARRAKAAKASIVAKEKGIRAAAARAKPAAGKSGSYRLADARR